MALDQDFKCLTIAALGTCNQRGIISEEQITASGSYDCRLHVLTAEVRLTHPTVIVEACLRVSVGSHRNGGGFTLT